jgi:alkaline phosphatase
MKLPQKNRRLLGGATAVTVVACTAAAALVGTTGATADDTATVPKNRSVVIVNGDGMGPAQRTFLQDVIYGPQGPTQPIDDFPVAGTLKTMSADPKEAVTDSAAGATAWSIGQKTVNGYVGVDKDGKPVKTLLEAARDAGKTTAIIEDHDVTNATVGAFAAHTKDRDLKRDMARQYVRYVKPDIMFGGGERIWYPGGNPGKIPNDDDSSGLTNMVDEAVAGGWQYAYDKATVAALTGPKALALVQDDGLMKFRETKGYDETKDPAYVPEHELVAKALEIAAKDPEGFFMAVDVDEVDDAGHVHDGQTLIKSGLEINKIATVLKDFQATHPETLVIITADHETGGMTIENIGDGSTNVAGDDPIPAYDEEHPINVSKTGKLPKASGPFKVKGDPYGRSLGLDWTTPEHTGVDVPVTAIGPSSQLLAGVHQNTFVHQVALNAMFGQ